MVEEIKDTTIYVKAPSFVLPAFKEFEQYLVENFQLEKFQISGDFQNMIGLISNYWAINFEKKAFVSSSSSYNNKVLSIEEFKHMNRGRVASIKYNL